MAPPFEEGAFFLQFCLPPSVSWPSAAEWVAKGQTEFFERSEKNEGPSEERAPQHSGGRPSRRLAGRGPQKKQKNYAKMDMDLGLGPLFFLPNRRSKKRNCCPPKSRKR
ncbi:hypothetical protein SGRA_2754 [Saprospira grandis str. Lewin]|uniref:Uncharacterized protein n=1 Tax=Saprospira grandis (strain Lewin) TaxID=984262 RepID=H6L9K6_SAPGL|nr:hypothetical protein SGRA_2754 [Saprospira grandis str. Lewin]